MIVPILIVLLAGAILGMTLDFSGLPPDALLIYWLAYSAAALIGLGLWCAHTLHHLGAVRRAPCRRPIPATLKHYRKS